VLAFLADAKEHPDDNTPRLVLADWLDEHGDERGEFVRLQCQRTTPGCTRREAELFRLRQANWLAVLAEKGIRTEMQRGLVSVWGTPRKLLSKRLAALGPYEPTAWVDRLSLDDFAPDDLASLATSPHWTCLTQLELRKHFYYADHLVADDTHGRSSGDWSALADLPVLSRATELNINCQDIGASGMSSLAAQPDLSRLRTLDLACNNLGSGGAVALASARSLTSLTFLNLTHNRIGAEGFVALAAWRGLASLTKLWLNQNYPGEQGITALATSPWLGNLRELRMNADSMAGMTGHESYYRRQRIGYAGAVALAGARTLTRLTHLTLAQNNIGPEGATALAASRALPALVGLDLGDNEIGDDGAIALANSQAMANLTTLSLRYNGITDRGAEALAASPYLTRLTAFNFGANRDTTPQGLASLKARFGMVLET
jgi:uncharacterized protein (TIGR02996 family)